MVEEMIEKIAGTIQMTSRIAPLIAAGLLAVSGFAGQSAIAGVVNCYVEDATANGDFADQCVGDDALQTSTDEKNFVTSNFVADLNYVGKYNDGTGFETGDLSGFTLTVTESDATVNGIDYVFSYTLATTNPDYVGKTIKFVLGIKQASDSFIAYYWEAVTLDIGGTFNSYWMNPAGKPVNNYSHASAWVKLAGDEPPSEIPIPGSLFLLGAPLLGFGAYRYYRR